MPSRCVTPGGLLTHSQVYSVYTHGRYRIGDLYHSNQLTSLTQAVQLSKTMASCSRVAMNASNKRSRKAKHSGKKNFDLATDGHDMDDFLPPKTRFGALDSDF